MLALLMLLTGYSDRLDPSQFPVLACAGMLFPFMVMVNLGVMVFWLFVSWRHALIPLAGLVLAYSPIRTVVPLNPTQQLPDSCIKVMSYNVCGYSGVKRFDQPLDTIMSYLKEVKPDILCIQEDYRHNPDPVALLKEIFPYNDTVHVKQNRTSELNAVGIHTRYPILRKEYIPYESKGNGSAAFFLLVDGDTVLVVNNHLESFHLSPEDKQQYKDMLKGRMKRDSAQAETRFLIGKISQGGAIRAPQARAVHDYIVAHSQYPLIVCGDFNDTPVSYARRTIAQGLTDCFVESGWGAGLSYNQKGFNFRIDQMMCSADFTPYNCYVDSKMEASDHNPVICWLKKVEKP